MGDQSLTCRVKVSNMLSCCALLLFLFGPSLLSPHSTSRQNALRLIGFVSRSELGSLASSDPVSKPESNRSENLTNTEDRSNPKPNLKNDLTQLDSDLSNAALPDDAAAENAHWGDEAEDFSCIDPEEMGHSASVKLLSEKGEKFMWYSPHSGFSNQAQELTNALKIAMLLNRTLIVPPVFYHFDLEQGTCLDPIHGATDLRKLSWEVIAGKISGFRYVSMADIIDLSSIKSIVKTIDLRVFVALWCGLDIAPACSGPVCRSMATDHRLHPWGSYASCAARLFPPSSSNAHRLGDPRPSDGSCLVQYVDDNCRTAVWSYGESLQVRTFLEDLLMKELHNDSTLPQGDNASSTHIQRKDVIETLGPGSLSGRAFLLSFGSLFSRTYKDMQLMVDINELIGDDKISSNLKEIGKRPFSEDILETARHIVTDKIKEQFFCAHVRLTDGVFTSEREKRIYKPLQEALEHLSTSSKLGGEVNVFLMTDLPPKRWAGTYLHELDINPQFKIHTLFRQDNLLSKTARTIALREHGLLSGFLPEPWRNMEIETTGRSQEPTGLAQNLTMPLKISDVRLFVEEVICSCATLGFFGTEGSTISKNVMLLRRDSLCPLSNPQ